MDWREIGSRWENSVVQLLVTKANYNVLRPYINPTDDKVRGSGFIVDIDRGIVVTNAHVVMNAISIYGRVPKFGQRDLCIRLLSICQEKDLALCQIDDNDRNLLITGLTNPTELNMLWGDNIELSQTDEVMAIGYPLGEEQIKFTTGIVSGFKARDRADKLDEEDAKARDPTYVQITAAINPGNSGGPLLNKKGEVVGITAAGYLLLQNIGYAIGTRTLLSIYHEMLTNPIVKIPTLALGWSKTTRDLMKFHCGSGTIYGIYVRKIYPDSCLKGLHKGDIITHISYEDLFQNTISIIHGYLDRYGDIVLIRGTSFEETLDTTPQDDTKYLVNRKINLAEVIDMIPIGSQMSLQICRDKQLYKLVARHTYIPTDRIMKICPRLTPCDYEIFAGLCCTELSLNHTKDMTKLDKLVKSDTKRYQKYVIITQIFPDTSASKAQVFCEGDVIREINNTKIATLEDLRKILSSRPPLLAIENDEFNLFVANLDTIIPEDKAAMKTFGINSSRYLLG